MTRLVNEPVLVVAVLNAVLVVAVAFGLDLTDEQLGAVVALGTAVMAVPVRQSVTPTRQARDGAAIAG